METCERPDWLDDICNQLAEGSYDRRREICESEPLSLTVDQLFEQAMYIPTPVAALAIADGEIAAWLMDAVFASAVVEVGYRAAQRIDESVGATH